MVVVRIRLEGGSVFSTEEMAHVPSVGERITIAKEDRNHQLEVLGVDSTTANPGSMFQESEPWVIVRLVDEAGL